MRVLLSTIGSRGEVQPVTALAVRLRDLGHEVRVCAPPDFRELIGALGIPFVPVGPQLHGTASAAPPAGWTKPSPEQLRQLAEGSVATQFVTVAEAAEGCDMLVAGGALQFAARSVAEHFGIPYVYASFCAVTLPSPHHAPPPLTLRGEKPADGTVDNSTLWQRDAQRWNETFSAALNSHRKELGLDPVTDVRSHIFTDTPWLAADPVLGPWPDPEDRQVVQTGAWILPDRRPLSAELEAFLDAGEPPVYFGFGSMRAPSDLSRTMIEVARALGRRAIVSRGWADLALVDDQPDCLSIGEVNQQALFPRVAAVVHHGGAGTTTAAGAAGAPQVVVPQMYDQFYWAQRVDELGIGTAHAPGIPTTDSLTTALNQALQPKPRSRAQAVSKTMRPNGAATAAQRIQTTPKQTTQTT